MLQFASAVSAVMEILRPAVFFSFQCCNYFDNFSDHGTIKASCFYGFENWHCFGCFSNHGTIKASCFFVFNAAIISAVSAIMALSRPAAFLFSMLQLLRLFQQSWHYQGQLLYCFQCCNCFGCFSNHGTVKASGFFVFNAAIALAVSAIMALSRPAAFLFIMLQLLRLFLHSCR